jgi:hypothetical protein
MVLMLTKDGERAGKRIKDSNAEDREIWGEFGQRRWWRRRSVLGFLEGSGLVWGNGTAMEHLHTAE